MTLLVALRSDATIWIGADARHVGMFSGDSWGTNIEKLFRLGNHHVVWGWYGEGRPAIEEEVGLHACASWEDIERTFNAIRNQYRAPVATLGMLVAGYFGDDGRIVHVGHDNDQLATRDALACGYCKMAMLTGLESSRAVCGHMDDAALERCFDASLQTTIRVSNGTLTEPRSVWRMTPTSCDQIVIPKVKPNG